jgi:DNA adenine methylase
VNSSSTARKIPFDVEPSGSKAPIFEVLELDGQQEESRTPPLKWAGGKRWLVPTLRKLFEPHRQRRLVEPFAGGLAVALGLAPQKALLCDLNPHVINFYHWLKLGLVTQVSMENEKEHYYAARTRFNELISAGDATSKEAAALFYYLNRTCFNGLCRFNSKGHFNVPFGKYKTINYLSDFSKFKSIFAGWSFLAKDFEALKIGPEDFLYIDPPYDVEFTKYAKEDFKWEDQVRLVEWLKDFGGPVVASNQATERIIKLYQEAGFKVELISAPRRISCTGNRSPAMEILALKNL